MKPISASHLSARGFGRAWHNGTQPARVPRGVRNSLRTGKWPNVGPAWPRPGTLTGTTRSDLPGTALMRLWALPERKTGGGLAGEPCETRAAGRGRDDNGLISSLPTPGPSPEGRVGALSVVPGSVGSRGGAMG